MFVHHNEHDKTKETSDLKIANFKKGIGIEKASNEKVWKQGKVSDSMEKSQRWSSRIIKVRDGARGSLKNESK